MSTPERGELGIVANRIIKTVRQLDDREIQQPELLLQDVRGLIASHIEAEVLRARIDELNGFRDWVDEMHDEPIVFQFANRLVHLETKLKEKL